MEGKPLDLGWAEIFSTPYRENWATTIHSNLAVNTSVIDINNEATQEKILLHLLHPDIVSCNRSGYLIHSLTIVPKKMYYQNTLKLERDRKKEGYWIKIYERLKVFLPTGFALFSSYLHEVRRPRPFDCTSFMPGPRSIPDRWRAMGENWPSHRRLRKARTALVRDPEALEKSLRESVDGSQTSVSEVPDF